MAENKLASSKSILIFVIVLFAFIASLSIASYLSSVKNILPVAVQPTKVPTVTSTPDIGISDWRTYRNEEVGIEFEYPAAILGDVETSKSDNFKYPNNIIDGKNINISFKKEGIDNRWISFTFSTAGNKNIDSDCLKPLIYDGRGEVCKSIVVAGQKAVWKNSPFEDECFFSLSSSVFFNNISVSAYQNLSLSFFLEDLAAKLDKLYSCSDDKKMNEAYSEAVVQSKNIMERKNLSEKDTQRLNMVDRILASFKFIK